MCFLVHFRPVYRVSESAALTTRALLTCLAFMWGVSFMGRFVCLIVSLRDIGVVSVVRGELRWDQRWARAKTESSSRKTFWQLATFTGERWQRHVDSKSCVSVKKKKQSKLIFAPWKKKHMTNGNQVFGISADMTAKYAVHLANELG